MTALRIMGDTIPLRQNESKYTFVWDEWKVARQLKGTTVPFESKRNNIFVFHQAGDSNPIRDMIDKLTTLSSSTDCANLASDSADFGVNMFSQWTFLKRSYFAEVLLRTFIKKINENDKAFRQNGLYLNSQNPFMTITLTCHIACTKRLPICFYIWAMYLLARALYLKFRHCLISEWTRTIIPCKLYHSQF